ncbi:hypothetical protein ACFOY2_46005 [Nonomuraea purpurea]|uniref:Uncharacterized protein n=1 Tax=Nonomuraea purpurea TaxID=1849276 RepID=A0ABV8GPL8_9ACTN
MNTTMTEIADLATASGLADGYPIANLDGLTFHVWKPLEKNDPPITTIGDLKDWTDATLVQISQFGPSRLDKVKAALIAASNGATS